jgi:hypothetical protein
VLYPGFAKLEYDPGRAFLEVFVDACLASELKGFEPQHLANVINGEHACLAPMHVVPHLQIAIRSSDGSTHCPPGLGYFEFDGREDFTRRLIATCGQLGLREFEMAELSGLIDVSRSWSRSVCVLATVP